MSEEPAKTRKRRKGRRSLRVPVDEVPRPTQGAEDGASTMEMPALSDDEARTTLEDIEAPQSEELEVLNEEALLGAPSSVPNVPLEEEPTSVKASPLEAVEAPSVEVEVDDIAEEFDAGPTLVGATVDAEPARAKPTVGVVVQRVVSVVSTGRSSPPPPLEPEPELTGGADLEDLDVDLEAEAETTAAAEPEEAAEDLEEAEELVEEAASEEEPAEPPEEEPQELEQSEAAEEEHGEPEPEPAHEEPVVDARPDSELSEEELLEEEAEPARDSAPELDEELVEDESGTPSNRPPPPPKAGPAAAPPPPRTTEKPKSEEPHTARHKKPRKNWWEELFNDDYLRTVPIPHPKTIERQTDFIEQRFGLAKGATILDVGCGLGLHAVELTRRGYLVVGLDLSLPMLSRAADEAQEHGFKINFLHADIREMSFEGAFDAVLCWGTTLGYFDDDTNKLVVERLYHALKPRGLLMLDVVNRDFVIRNQPNLVWFEGDGCVVMEETQCNYITSRLQVKRTVILDDGRQRDSVYSLRLYALHELGQLLHLQGFRVVEVSGREAHPGVFFGADSPKLIILAERRPQGPPTPPRKSSTDLPALTEGAVGEPDSSAEPVAASPSEPSAAVAEAMSETLEESQELEAAEELETTEDE